MRNEIINSDQSPMFWKAYEIANRDARSLNPMKTFANADMIANPWKRGYMLGWADPIRGGGVPEYLYDGTYEYTWQNAAGRMLTLDSLERIGIRRIVRFANCDEGDKWTQMNCGRR